MAAEGVTVLVKVELNGEIRRIREWPQSGSSSTLEGLREAVWQLFENPLPVPPAFGIRALGRGESEQDELVLENNEQLSSLLASLGEGGVLRLAASYPPEEVSYVPAVPVPSNAPTSADALLTTPSAPPRALVASSGPASPPPSGDCFAGVKKGLKHLANNVKTDFMSNRDEMGQAWAPCTTENASHRKAANAAKVVTSNVAGVVAVSRLLPVRAAQLAAESMQNAPGAEDPRAEADSARSPRTSPTQEGSEAGSNTPVVEQFTRRVATDFKTVRKDVEKACRTFTRADEHQETAGNRLTWREGVPAVLGVAAAVSVTSALLELRVARLAVAAACGSCGARGSSTAEQPTEDGATDSAGVSPAAAVAANAPEASAPPSSSQQEATA
mmetsp:Transcript_63072/g.150314  ORF Transcript_63072/g.150314 Transcript_63072/m.150314 type:complete len:386 (-) Transcript_63072:208-1365(-)